MNKKMKKKKGRKNKKKKGLQDLHTSQLMPNILSTKPSFFYCHFLSF